MNEDTSLTGSSFGKSNRLLSSGAYKKVFEQNKKVSDNSFLILARKKQQDCPRMGLAVAKKVLRFAVDRNRLKRLIRESFRQHKTQLKSFDVVVMVRKDCQKFNNSQLLLKLDKLWNKLNPI